MKMLLINLPNTLALKATFLDKSISRIFYIKSTLSSKIDINASAFSFVNMTCELLPARFKQSNRPQF